MNILLLGSLSLLATSMTCPTFRCGQLGENLCARKASAQVIELNQQPCTSDRFCAAERLYEDWWWYAFTAIDGMYECLESAKYRHIRMEEAATYSEWPCFQRSLGKDLASGSHPKDCVNDHDCLLEDGTFSYCLCSVRSSSTKGICSPDMSSSLFADYWSRCDEEGYIPDKDTGFYYSVVQRVYPILQSDIPCAQAVLWEFQIREMANSTIGSSAEAIAMLSLLSFTL